MKENGWLCPISEEQMCTSENHQHDCNLSGRPPQRKPSLFWQLMDKYLMIVYVHMCASWSRMKMRTGEAWRTKRKGWGSNVWLEESLTVTWMADVCIYYNYVNVLLCTCGIYIRKVSIWEAVWKYNANYILSAYSTRAPVLKLDSTLKSPGELETLLMLGPHL